MKKIVFIAALLTSHLAMAGGLIDGESDPTAPQKESACVKECAHGVGLSNGTFESGKSYEGIEGYYKYNFTTSGSENFAQALGIETQLSVQLYRDNLKVNQPRRSNNPSKCILIDLEVVSVKLDG